MPIPARDDPVTQEQLEQLLDRTLQWDQLNEHMKLTVQAVAALHTAFKRRFIHHE